MWQVPASGGAAHGSNKLRGSDLAALLGALSLNPHLREVEGLQGILVSRKQPRRCCALCQAAAIAALPAEALRSADVQLRSGQVVKLATKPPLSFLAAMAGMDPTTEWDDSRLVPRLSGILQ